MMAVVKKLLYEVTHYASRSLHANVQFSDIEKVMQSMKTGPFIICMVPGHKKSFADEKSVETG